MVKTVALASLLMLVIAGSVVAAFPKVEFILGGAMVNFGYRLQDRLANYDFVHDESISPQEIWEELKRQNEMAAAVRGLAPRTVQKPVVTIVACMDARIDTNELVGDTRRYYFVVRTAGSILSNAEQEMLELAVMKGVRVIVLTSHTDCAAEAAAKRDDLAHEFPALTSLVVEREKRIQQFLARPRIREAIDSGNLLVKRARIDTETERFLPDIPFIPTATISGLD